MLQASTANRSLWLPRTSSGGPGRAPGAGCQLQQATALSSQGPRAANSEPACLARSASVGELRGHVSWAARPSSMPATVAQAALATLCAAALCLCQVAFPAEAAAYQGSGSVMAGPRDSDTFENVPGQLRSDGDDARVPLGSLFNGSKGKEVETCTRKCLPACIRGGEGAPGLGPITLRREVVVFKQGFRTRAYCLSECAQVCSLSINGPNGPGGK